MHRKIHWMVAVVTAASLLASCGGGGDSEDPGGPPPPVTSRTPSGELPEGHPPLADSPDASIVPPPPGSGAGASGLTWSVPSGWVAETPSSNMRRAQYRVPGSEGDGECVVFYFGPGQGGDPMSNATRWAGQFKQPDGRDSAEVMTTSEIDVGGIPVLLVEVAGTYANLMVSDQEMPRHMLLGAVAQGPDSNWFFKLTGPEATVREQRAAFEEMARSIRSGGS
jgi:hypothetical protein